MLNRYKTFFVFLFICLSSFAIEFITPYHSDDYFYSQMAFDFNKHLDHYLNWSGRLVADYLSTFMLSLNSHFFISIILSLCISFLCYFIASLPTRIIRAKTDPLVLLITYLLYWICNASLGQTTFWIVGACNYLITNFFILLFLYLFLTFKRTNNIFIKLFIFTSAIIAGCTNENTSITLIISYILLVCVLKKYDKDLNLFTMCFYLFGLVMGTLILLLAPGNYKRAASKYYDNWHMLSMINKIKLHIDRVLSRLYHFLPIMFVYIINIILKYFTNKQKNICFVISLIFILSTFISLGVFVVSPDMPSRAFNGTLVFFLVSLSFLIYSINSTSKIIFKVCTSCVFVIFVYSYSCVAYSYNTALKENKIIVEQIEYSKHKNYDKTMIPSYYFPKLLKIDDRFDMYHSESMASYFGAKYIEKPIQMDYNYTIIKDNKNILETINKYNDIKLYYKNSNIFDKNGTIIIQVNDLNIIKYKNIYIKFFNIRDKEINTLKFDNKYIDICGKYYSGITIKNLNISGICDLEIK